MRISDWSSDVCSSDLEGRSLQSFVAQAQRASPEVEGILCIAPVETAAEKLSALTWRVLSRQRGEEGDDPRLIRHLHDLAALEDMVREHSEFPRLVEQEFHWVGDRGRSLISFRGSRVPSYVEGWRCCIGRAR